MTNKNLERRAALYTLIDGIDATLIDLAAEELGVDVLVAEATRIAGETLAARQADDASKTLLNQVFELRARRVAEVGRAGRLGWLRETGARLRMIDSVEMGLLPKPVKWDAFEDPLDPDAVNVIMEWAWVQPDVQEGVRKAHLQNDETDTSEYKTPLFNEVWAWLRGQRFQAIATASGQDIDTVLGVHGQVVSYVLQVTVEQGIALLEKLLEGNNQTLAAPIVVFPEHLRYGVPTAQGRILAADGLRHRSAAVELGNALRGRGEDKDVLKSAALKALLENEPVWRNRLGDLVYANTLWDLGAPTSNAEETE